MKQTRKTTQKHFTSAPTCIKSLYLSLFFGCLLIPFSSLFAQYENIVINEISGDGGNIEAGNDAIVELAGMPGTDIGCMVITNTEWAIVLPAGATIPSDGVFVIGCENRNNASNGYYTGANTGLSCSVCDFPGLQVDFDVCNDANAAYVSASLYTNYGFTLDNPTCNGNKDGDQVILFRPDGTPHDAIYWGAADLTNANGGGITVGGASGSCGASSDHVSVQIGVPYTLGDNDENGIINDYTGSHIGFKSSGADATAVNLMPNGNDDLSNPELEGAIVGTPPGDCDADTKIFTVPPLNNPIWVNAGLSLGSCNSTHIRINDTSPQGNSVQEESTSTSSSHKDDPDLNMDWIAYLATTLIPSSINPTMATNQWQITNHPNPGQPNDADSWDFFYDIGSGAIEIIEQENININICSPQKVSFSVKVYNHQHVEPTIRTSFLAGSFVRDETGTDQAWTITSVGSSITDGSAPSNEDGITTFTFTSNTLASGSINFFTLVWDDYTNCCGSGSNNTVVNQSDAHECYEKMLIKVTVGKPITLSDTEITCPNDFIKNVGQIDFSSFVTSSNSFIQYNLRAGVTPGMETTTGTLVASNTIGAFELSNTLTTPIAVIIEDRVNCSPPQVITIEDDCLATPPCPKPVGATITKTGTICPNEPFTLSLDGTDIPDLPNGGTIDWYYGMTGFDPFADEGMLLGQSPIAINEITIGPVINEIMVRPSANNGQGGAFFELAGPPGFDLSCYIMTDGDWDIVFPLGTKIPADGFLVVGSKTKAQVSNNQLIDIDLDLCGCFNLTNMVLSDAGEFLALYDPLGTFLDGVIWGNPTGNNEPNAHSTETINVAPIPSGCFPPPSVTTFGHGFINSGISEFPIVGISMERDIDATGIWQISDVPSLSTPGTSNNGTVRTPVVDALTTTLGELACNKTIEIKGVVNPATIISGACEESDVTTTAFELTVICPEADLEKEDKTLCLPINEEEILATINLSNGSGNYDVEIELNHNGTTTILNKNNVINPLEITYADLIAALGTTIFSEVELTINNVKETDGTECTGKKDNDLILLTIQSGASAKISEVNDLTDCVDPFSGSLTFEFGPTNSGPWEFEYTVNEGSPIVAVANTTPYILPVSVAGNYQLQSVHNLAGCTGKIDNSIETVNAPIVLNLNSITNTAVCNNGFELVDLNRDIIFNLNDSGHTITGNAAAIGNIKWYKSDPTLLPIQLRSLVSATSTIFIPVTKQDYFFVYKDPNSGCEIIGKTTVDVAAFACCAADAGDIIPPLDLLENMVCIRTNLEAFRVSYGFIDENEPNASAFQYIFLLVNENGQIVQKESNGIFDFSTVKAGLYNVYGLSYANNNSPNDVLDYLNNIGSDLDIDDISQIESDEQSTIFCLNLDSLVDSGGGLITVKDCVASIPTISEWGLLIFGLLLLNLGSFLVLKFSFYENNQGNGI